MQERGADNARIKVMYTGVRLTQAPRLDEVRDQIRGELNIPSNMPVIIFAGRICEQKRPETLAAILNAARDHGLVFRALVIGDGEQKGQFEDLLNQYRLSANVQMLGSIPHQRWLDILAASDILLMPSQYEGISIALLEAMATGVVPVVANVGGQEEIVSPDAGILIPHGDNEIQQYLDALDSLLSNSAKLQKMSKQCRILSASKLSWEGMIDKFLAILGEAHQLRVDHPRNPVSLGFGRELATQSLEYKRLGENPDWLCNKLHSETTVAELQSTSAEVQAIVKFAVVLSQTRFSRMIIRNRFMRSIAKTLLEWMK
jgi:glycosyltransferase involved in cell wall biosynthesis